MGMCLCFFDLKIVSTLHKITQACMYAGCAACSSAATYRATPTIAQTTSGGGPQATSLAVCESLAWATMAWYAAALVVLPPPLLLLQLCVFLLPCLLFCKLLLVVRFLLRLLVLPLCPSKRCCCAQFEARELSCTEAHTLPPLAVCDGDHTGTATLAAWLHPIAVGDFMDAHWTKVSVLSVSVPLPHTLPIVHTHSHYS